MLFGVHSLTSSYFQLIDVSWACECSEDRNIKVENYGHCSIANLAVKLPLSSESNIVFFIAFQELNLPKGLKTYC